MRSRFCILTILAKRDEFALQHKLSPQPENILEVANPRQGK